MIHTILILVSITSAVCHGACQISQVEGQTTEEQTAQVDGQEKGPFDLGRGYEDALQLVPADATNAV